MILPPSVPFRSLLLVALIWNIVTGCPSAIAQQTHPAAALPEEVKGAKIYQLPAKGGRPAPNPAVYQGLSFRDINFDRLLLDLSVSIRPVDRSATVERMYFQDVRVSGIPVHIETFAQPFKLSNKTSIDLPGPLRCSILFSELDSLKPVREMVDKDKIQITGQSFIQVKLNALEKLALGTKQIVIPVALNEQVPLNLFQGNPLLQMTADKILDTLADPSSTAAVSMAKEHLDKLRMDQTLGAKLQAALFLLDTEYVVRDPKTQAEEKFSQVGTGFLVTTDGKLLTTKRVVAPWKFDPQVAFLVEHRHLKVDPASVRTYAWPAGSKLAGPDGQPDFAAALSTEKQTLKLLATAPDQTAAQDYQDPDSDEHVTLKLHREGDADLALLQVSGTGFQPLPFQKARDNSSALHLVLGSYPYGLNQPATDPRLLAVTFNPQGDAPAMDHQVDPGETGAPLLDSEGAVVAIAASGGRCISIEAARKLIP